MATALPTADVMRQLGSGTQAKLARLTPTGARRLTAVVEAASDGRPAVRRAPPCNSLRTLGVFARVHLAAHDRTGVGGPGHCDQHKREQARRAEAVVAGEGGAAGWRVARRARAAVTSGWWRRGWRRRGRRRGRRGEPGAPNGTCGGTRGGGGAGGGGEGEGRRGAEQVERGGGCGGCGGGRVETGWTAEAAVVIRAAMATAGGPAEGSHRRAAGEARRSGCRYRPGARTRSCRAVSVKLHAALPRQSSLWAARKPVGAMSRCSVRSLGTRALHCSEAATAPDGVRSAYGHVARGQRGGRLKGRGGGLP